MENLKKSVVFALAGLSLAFLLTLAWNWESFKEGWNSYQCECPAQKV